MMQSVITWKYLRSFIKIYSELGLKVQKSEIPTDRSVQNSLFLRSTQVLKPSSLSLSLSWSPVDRSMHSLAVVGRALTAHTHTRAPCLFPLIFLHSTFYRLMRCMFLYLLLSACPSWDVNSMRRRTLFTCLFPQSQGQLSAVSMLSVIICSMNGFRKCFFCHNPIVKTPSLNTHSISILLSIFISKFLLNHTWNKTFKVKVS